MSSPTVSAEIGRRLHAARQASGRTLDDIAAATRINRRFLEEIEAGRTPGVPEIYARAFIKTFAAEVGERPEELLALMQQAPAVPDGAAAPAPEAPRGPKPHPQSVREAPPRVDEAPRAAAAPGSERQAPPAPAPESADRSGRDAARRQAKTLVGFAFLVVAGLVVSMYWLRNDKSEKKVQEISFADVEKEQAAKFQGASGATDSGRAQPVAASPKPGAPPPKAAVKGDSLLLQAVTSESVWVHIELDGATVSEYSLPPGFKVQWKAATQFSVSLGNPAGITFTLNGRPLGRLAEGKRPLRNRVLTRSTLEQR